MMKQISEKLWNVISNSSVYSFYENPLPLYNAILLMYLFKGEKRKIDILSKDWVDTIISLVEGKDLSTLPQDILDVLCQLANEGILTDRSKAVKIVEFLSEKYYSHIIKDMDNPILSDNLQEFIYWLSTGIDSATTDLGLFNPYAGIGSFGVRHLKGLSQQLSYDIERNVLGEDAEKYKSHYREHTFYKGLENNETLRFIANVRLIFNTDITSLEHVRVNSLDANDFGMDGYIGGWTLVTVPPINFHSQPTSGDVDLVHKMMEEFINANGMSNAYIVLPKSFCYDDMYSDIRRMLVCRGMIKGVIELSPNEFLSYTEAILVCLSKSSWECGIKMIDGRTFHDQNIFDIIELYFYEESKSKYKEVLGDYTLSQCDYCLLPSVYVKTDGVSADNESLNKSLSKYHALIEEKKRSEKRRIEHRNISEDLSHMLSGIYHNIEVTLSEIDAMEGMENVCHVLRDNVDYLKRLINSIDRDFSEINDFSEVGVNKFFETFCRSWSNYGKKGFKLDYISNLDDETTFRINDVFMKVMLDSILNNAHRHGFSDESFTHNPRVEIATSYAKHNNGEYIRITISNNGAALPQGFTLEKYIKEGEFGGPKGNSGRGGYHVYQITKAHKGYLGIDSNKEWNVIIGILIPVEDYNEYESVKFTQDGEQFYI